MFFKFFPFWAPINYILRNVGFLIAAFSVTICQNYFMPIIKVPGVVFCRLVE